LPSGAPSLLAGWLGAALGAPLAGVFGWLGAGLLLLFALAAVCVVTIGWNPLRSLVRGGRSPLGGARRGVAAGAALFPRGGTVEMPGVAQDPDPTPPLWLDEDDVTLTDPPLRAPEPATTLAAPAPPVPPPRAKSRRASMEVVAEEIEQPVSDDLP